MKRHYLFVVLCLLCMAPAAIVGFVNRPKTSPVWTETQQAVPFAQAAVMNPTITLKPTVIKGSKQQTQKPLESGGKVWVCRDIPMLNGGTVQYCDYL